MRARSPHLALQARIRDCLGAVAHIAQTIGTRRDQAVLLLDGHTTSVRKAMTTLGFRNPGDVEEGYSFVAAVSLAVLVAAFPDLGRNLYAPTRVGFVPVIGLYVSGNETHATWIDLDLSKHKALMTAVSS